VEKAFYFSAMKQEEKILQVSTSYRWMENGHILLWLIKDFCWALEFKPGGIFMVIPTVSVAFYITWRSRHMRSELFHNSAVCCWILANSIWMLGEFFEHEARPYAASIFGLGLLILAFYYSFFFKKDRKAEKQLNN
jgi:drug/metabolite transporter (DMT)-like permease